MTKSFSLFITIQAGKASFGKMLWKIQQLDTSPTVTTTTNTTL